MARYVSRKSVIKPRADWIDDDYPMIPNLEVCDFEAADTGLLDASGHSIWREPNPIGFGRDDEW